MRNLLAHPVTHDEKLETLDELLAEFGSTAIRPGDMRGVVLQKIRDDLVRLKALDDKG